MRVFRSLRWTEVARASKTHPVTQRDLFRTDATNVGKRQWHIATEAQVDVETIRVLNVHRIFCKFKVINTNSIYIALIVL